jgi:hypothetical protein
VTKETASVAFERRLRSRWTVGVALGGVVDGTLVTHGQSFALSPGPLFAVTGSYRPLDEGRIAPFVLITGSVAASVGSTVAESDGTSSSLTAVDFRLGVLAGKTIANMLTLYAVGRVFGGPILWSVDGRSVLGSDAYHVQLGAGLVLRLKRFDLVFEGVPLGEQSIVGGLGMAL